MDETFGNRFPQALGDTVLHHAFKDQMPGRVDLWPMIEPTKNDADENWEDPVDLIAETHHSARLAEKIAREIKAMIDGNVQIPVDKDEAAAGCRPVHAGDFLILVQRRSALFSEIIRACKKADLPIAGADRLKLGAELAVKDLAALLAFLATQDDDLALASLLRSPLCGWTEAELYDLAQGRKGYLWEALRNRTDHPETLAMLTDLRDQADFLRPFDLIERALTRHDGRRRLLARLGPEAEDGIDELLSQALAYERSDIPSLTGFQIWLETDDIEVKRQMDSAGRRIRVMTVHGAKGLEAPIVILPDTADRNPQDRDEIYTLPGDVPVWKTGADDSPDAIGQVRAARRAKTEQESLRLLYVALTRARAWLIVAGAGTVKSEGAWHRLVSAGMQAVGAVAATAGALRYQLGDWPEAAEKQALTQPKPDALPDWTARLAPDVKHPAPLISPSALGGAKVLAGETDGLTEDEAKARGTALHLLLEHLPLAAQADWPQIAAMLLPDPALCRDVSAEASGVLTAPALAPLFGPGTLAEVAITADLAGGRLYGAIDRLLITDSTVLAVDYKSNHTIPDNAAQIPEGLLRQLGAYAHALRQIYPTRQIETAILWTRRAQLMPVDPDIVSAALSRTTIDGAPPLDVASGHP